MTNSVDSIIESIRSNNYDPSEIDKYLESEDYNMLDDDSKYSILESYANSIFSSIDSKNMIKHITEVLGRG